MWKLRLSQTLDNTPQKHMMGYWQQGDSEIQVTELKPVSQWTETAKKTLWFEMNKRGRNK